MDNEAIGDITIAVRNLLQQAIGEEYQVTLCSPWENFGDESGINLFLYKVMENPQWKNMDWSGDRSHPTSTSRAPLSLELFYLLTSYAPRVNTPITDSALNHKILGKAMHILHENPVLNDIHHTFFDADNDEHFPGNLRNSFEKIQVSLNPIDMEEMSRIWSMGDKDYRLSVAYHVSLVQIAPTIPARPGVPIQETGVEVMTMAPPTIAKLEPASGPVGTELHIKGQNLQLKVFKTIVKISRVPITEFIRANEREIVLAVPHDLKQGPKQEITVIINDRESKPVLFYVSPWITGIKPQRGAVDKGNALSVPIDIHGFDFQSDVQISIGGTAVSPDKITFVSENLIKTYVPNTLVNGPHKIELKVNGNETNKRSFEVIPFILNITPLTGQVGDSIDITGQRLDGNYVRIHIGPSVIAAGENTNPDQISFKVPSLIPGKYELKVEVDGHESNIETFEVIE